MIVRPRVVTYIPCCYSNTVYESTAHFNCNNKAPRIALRNIICAIHTIYRDSQLCILCDMYVCCSRTRIHFQYITHTHFTKYYYKLNLAYTCIWICDVYTYTNGETYLSKSNTTSAFGGSSAK